MLIKAVELSEDGNYSGAFQFVAAYCGAIAQSASAQANAENAALKARVDHLEGVLRPLATVADLVKTTLSPEDFVLWSKRNTATPHALTLAHAIAAKEAIKAE